MLFLAFLFLYACSSNTAEKTSEATETKTADSAAPAKKMPIELMDPSIGEPFRAATEAFSKGDVDGFTANYADNIRFFNSSGDSLIGREAVKTYFEGRRKLMDSVSFAEHIFLPVQINEAPAGTTVQTGKWLLHWTRIDVKYKNGKKIRFYYHQVNHFNDANKVDFAATYYDRTPIIAATKGLVVK